MKKEKQQIKDERESMMMEIKIKRDKILNVIVTYPKTMLSIMTNFYMLIAKKQENKFFKNNY